MSAAEDLARCKRRTPREVSPRPDAVWVCRLRQERHRLGLTIRDVAGGVGLSTAGYHAIENGSDPLLTTAPVSTEEPG